MIPFRSMVHNILKNCLTIYENSYNTINLRGMYVYMYVNIHMIISFVEAETSLY